MMTLAGSQSFHAGAQAAFDAVPTPTEWHGVADAQRAVLAVWEGRGSYGCEHHLYVDAMRRVSGALYL